MNHAAATARVSPSKLAHTVYCTHRFGGMIARYPSVLDAKVQRVYPAIACAHTFNSVTLRNP